MYVTKPVITYKTNAYVSIDNTSQVSSKKLLHICLWTTSLVKYKNIVYVLLVYLY